MHFADLALFYCQKIKMSQELNELDQKLAKEIGWKTPRYPFVAFRAKKCLVLGDAEKDPRYIRQDDLELETGLRAYETINDYNVKGVHRQVDKLQAIMRNKRYKVAAWGNFPKPDSLEAKATKSGPADPDDWQVLEQFLQREYSGQIRESREVQGLRAKVAELEAKQSKKANDAK